MEVLIIAPRITKPYGGPSAVVANTLRGFLKIEKELIKNDVKIRFLSIGDQCKKLELSENIEVICAQRLPVPALTGEIQTLLFSRRFGIPDVVHAHYLYELFPWISKDVPSIYTLHGILWKERELARSFKDMLYYSIEERRFRAYYDKLTKFIAISPYVIKELLSKGFDVSKAEVIGNPVSDDFFNIKKREENVILYPAVITPRKNQLGFLKAVNLVKDELGDYNVIFTGSGDRDYFLKVKNYSEKNNLNVEFLGKVPYEKLLDLYSMAAVVALTSFQETQPMAILESLATGTPVVASNVGGVPYILGDGGGLIVDPFDVGDIAEKLLILASDKRIRRKFGRQGRNSVERFKSKNIASRLLKVYSNTLRH